MSNSKIYYVDKPYLREAIMMLAFKSDINWLEEGMSVLSWKYKKIATVKEIDHNKIYKNFKRWPGNNRSKKTGHRTISIGDVVKVGDNVRIVTGSGWVVIPMMIWNRIRKD